MKSFDEELEGIKQICGSEQFLGDINRTKELLRCRPLVLYGAGAVGASAAKAFRSYGIGVSCFCDKNKAGVHEESGLPVISPAALVKDYPNANIVICSVNYKDEIISDLEALGVSPDRIFSRAFLNFHEMVLSDVKQHFAGYKRAFELYCDDKSRRVLMERIKCYLTAFPITFSPISASPQSAQYFDKEIITLSDSEVFVDGGMYTGDTAGAFFNFTGGRYSHYYGFEPDEKNFLKAERSLKNKCGVTVVHKGLWSSEATLSFCGSLASSSRLSTGGGGSFVEVTSLDSYFAGKTPPTFIKMDIEGAELEAIIGSRHIIREYRPRLAICAYHKPEDLYTLPEKIKSYRDDYKFYLRHYTESIYETVLYAV